MKKDEVATKQDIQDLANLIGELTQIMSDRFDRLEAIVAQHGTVLNDHEIRLSRAEKS